MEIWSYGFWFWYLVLSWVAHISMHYFDLCEDLGDAELAIIFAILWFPVGFLFLCIIIWKWLGKGVKPFMEYDKHDDDYDDHRY